MEYDGQMPYMNLMEEESKNIVYNFCTICSLIKGKKLNFQHVFIILLTDDILKDILKNMLSADNDYEVYKTVLQIDPTIAKSKYVSRISRLKYKNDN